MVTGLICGTALVIAGLVKHEFAQRRRVWGGITSLRATVNIHEEDMGQLWVKVKGLETSIQAYAELSERVEKLNKLVTGEAISRKLGR
jgi:hypothetical protein